MILEEIYDLIKDRFAVPVHIRDNLIAIKCTFLIFYTNYVNKVNMVIK